MQTDKYRLRRWVGGFHCIKGQQQPSNGDMTKSTQYDHDSFHSRKDDATVEHDEALDITKPPEHGAVETVSYGPSGIGSLLDNKFVFGAALLASLGGFSMGYDMGVISIINVMEEFHSAFPQTATEFGKGFMTGMMLLGAFVGCLFMSWLADRISRKWALTVVVVVFDIGAILQTAAQSYDMLIAGRFIGGIGVGTLAMVRSSVGLTLVSQSCMFAN
jgi:hypothetical protein